MLYHINRFRDRFDNQPVAEEASWEHFTHRFKDRAVRAGKDGPLFSPVRYLESLDGYRVESFIFDKEIKDKKIGQVWANDKKERAVTTMANVIVRRNDNVRQIDMAVFDYDSQPATESAPAVIQELAPIREAWKDYNHIIYSSFSSSQALPKFRLILPLKEPLNPAQFKLAWPFGLQIASIETGWKGADKSCKDLSRMFYLPSCPPGKEAEAFVHIVTDKKFFSPKIPKDAKPAAPKPKKKRRGDYNTLDAVTWFSVHGAYLGPAGQEHKHHVVCPWHMNHTEGKQGETDTTLWTEPKKWPTFHCSHAHCAGKDIKAIAKLWSDGDEYCSEELTSDKLRTDTEIRCLGFDDSGRYYYQCNRTNHIVPLKSGEHKELNFYGITSDLTYWEKHFGDPDNLGRVRWKAAAAKLMNECHKKGFFKPEAVRGGGVWEDAGRIVAHLGRSLRVDGKDVSLTDFKSTFVYEAMVQEVELGAPASDEDLAKVLDLASRFPLASKSDAMFLAGSAVCGLLSGVTTWRPHIWLTGDQASGKSSILTYFLTPLWAPAGGVVAEGKTSDAGIRQKLRRNAYPVIVDESEADTRLDAERIEGIVSLVRSSSSVSEGRVLKGTISGQGLEFLVRSCFALCSITHALEKPQDRQRFTLIPCRMTEAHVNAWPDLKTELKATLTPEFALSFYARLISLVDLFRSNAQVYQRAIIDVLKADARVGEQLGHLLAGAALLQKPIAVTLEAATGAVRRFGGALPLSDKGESSAPQAALNTLFNFILQDGMSRKSVWEHIVIADTVGSALDTKQPYVDALKRHGLIVKDHHLFVSSNHNGLVALFKNAGITGHHGLLSLVEGATLGHTLRFGGHLSKAVRIPIPSDKEESK